MTLRTAAQCPDCGKKMRKIKVGKGNWVIDYKCPKGAHIRLVCGDYQGGSVDTLTQLAFDKSKH